MTGISLLCGFTGLCFTILPVTSSIEWPSAPATPTAAALDIMRASRITRASSVSSVSSASRVDIPVREVGAPRAVSIDTVGTINGLRVLSSGRVLVNDAMNRRLLLLDSSLANVQLVADPNGRSPLSYGGVPTGIIAYRGDSTLFLDRLANSFLVLDERGQVVRALSPPRPSDVQMMAGMASFGSPGFPGFDATGHVIYRGMIFPAYKPPERGKAYVPPQLPDSNPLLRGDFDRRVADTLAWLRVPSRKYAITPLGNGGVRIAAKINPMSTVDDWTLLADGSIAIVRGRDYHIDWINADGSHTSTPRMPMDWRKLSDDDKAAIIDSTVRAIDRQYAQAVEAANNGNRTPLEALGHSMTILPVESNDGGPAPRTNAATAAEAPTKPQAVDASDLPDYVPPLSPGTTRADRSGNVWILPMTSRGSGAGLLYDVVNRRGEIIERVRLPKDCLLQGFGDNGAIYMSRHDKDGWRLISARITS